MWTYSTAELVKVLAGERPQPSVEEFMAELPALSRYMSGVRPYTRAACNPDADS
ncbi:hypothetical protein GOA58_30785 [Sinorhizobium meliloti]|nr:hypothetical protein [Sinorhizobium meliloti]MDW9664952.1 hypothetical protein [Sinorhizobium meliloti]MDX0054759.1 hypothetical protein [Sinorhizobium meliloti]MDX1017237.1 hypothetical protein [Sinorhizobium medicae]